MAIDGDLSQEQSGCDGIKKMKKGFFANAQNDPLKKDSSACGLRMTGRVRMMIVILRQASSTTQARCLAWAGSRLSWINSPLAPVSRGRVRPFVQKRMVGPLTPAASVYRFQKNNIIFDMTSHKYGVIIYIACGLC